MELKKLFESDINNKSLIIQLRNNDEYKQALINATNFLPETATISERAYCYKNNITELQVCRFCGKLRKFRKMNSGYNPTCGNKECKAKAVAYGNKYNHNYDDIQKKIRQTYKEKTGYEHNMQNPEFLKSFFDKREETTGERYAIASDRSKKAREKTFLEKYGTNNVGEILHSDETKQLIIEKYGSYETYLSIRAKKSAKTKSKNELDILISKIKEMGYTYINSFLKDNITPYIHIKCNRCGTIFDVSRQAVNIYYRTNKFNFCTICDYKDNTYRSNFEKEVLYEIRNTKYITRQYTNIN